jgi:hypothetical protein
MLTKACLVFRPVRDLELHLADTMAAAVKSASRFVLRPAQKGLELCPTVGMKNGSEQRP